ncbi:hypothetical protein JG687_00016948 [Phytophthora cactorum]|uniref:RxLR effector protein n=1 Tax=Phytophthora cactorum TaxID=29920 RepID=A0A8T1TT75_9STRA|nr:hypothetical protein PC120_g18822 [Phytophthora cactorum]KAG3047589.1 hypothetical protein PC121_g19965 [Phytophthora cactorum]KAG3191376.1 hypothetical protein PC128_g10956 [Phytophthora cactorum]KAG4040629.1 hypothetical protein PC123_g23831 [Phytophthora cactorum]KAG6946036.1 hypothetical protein JG687_00016948 [Phytophthora cactorum]
MRLSLVLLVTAALFLLADTSARSTDLTTRQHLRQKVTLSNAVGASDLGNLGGQAFLRVLKSVEAVDASEGPEEERGLNGLFGWTKLNNLRKAERIKEIKEALAIAKVQVKVAAEAAAKAAAKAKEVKRIADQLDDVTVENMLKDPVFKDSVFKAWHKDNIHPQLVFDSLALPRKYTTAKWIKIGVAYTDYATKMAMAAARIT